MKKLIMLKGLQGSGKSTWALEQVRLSGGRIKRVNKDEIRAMVDGGVWSGGREKEVLITRDLLIANYLVAGHTVIVDDTNFAPKHEAHLKGLAEQGGAVFEIKTFDTPIEECIKRDLLRQRSVGERVIRDTYNRYLKPKDALYLPPVGKPIVVLCDIDGTLAHMRNRSPYDWSKVGDDDIDVEIAMLLHNMPHQPILISGRDEVCRKQTEEWLDRYAVDYEELFMRPLDDKRKDSIVKRELFEKYVRNDYHVRFVLDDRDQVVEMWRSMGLKCLQVARGDF